ncbi:spore germination protein [uncultured Psychrobacillus sp.]|uniref:spore germination protein n=1 Tax=uncultured Psychrobacillus sp. TaxID=1551585 RepID=UPI00262B884B|nr:spore germination protein [uncultured Psychrobacillus sp.]
MQQKTEIHKEIQRLNKQFLHSSDFISKEIPLGPNELVILCFYSSLVKKSEIDRLLYLLRASRKTVSGSGSYTAQNKSNLTENIQSDQIENNAQLELSEQLPLTTPILDDSVTITTEPYNNQKLIEYVCNGESIVILLDTNEMIRLNSPNFVYRTPDEPANEEVLRGSHEGFVENYDSNVSLIRKRIKNNKLIVKKIVIGKETNTLVYYFYMEDVVDQEALKTVEERLNAIDIDMFYSGGQLSDYLDDQVWSPFPQLLNTERPDRVVANILEGKIAIMTDITPTALIGPVTFFSFYQSPDDFNSRVLVGTFYRVMRILSFLTAIFLPAFYIAIVSFHFEVLPLELANKVKSDINQIPYRPLIEALIMEITIELIREASVRLPKSIGQTIGIVGGLVIGESIVSAGLVSNLMVIVVAFTAISSFVAPSVELNTSIRVLRFPFMILASLFGFFGIMIGTFILVVHLLNLSSLKRPYFSPIIPFEPKELHKIFFREPYYKAKKQVTSFSPQKDEES